MVGNLQILTKFPCFIHLKLKYSFPHRKFHYFHGLFQIPCFQNNSYLYMSNINSTFDQSFSLNEQIESFHNKKRYGLSIKLCSLLSIVFGIMSISFYHQRYYVFFIMFSVFLISLFGLTYTLVTKRFLLVYWVLSITGVGITSFALCFVPEAVHYPDYLWLFASI